jgi:hypothetical protein
MPWVEVFTVFVVSHLVGDYLVQTDWQARHKSGGLGGDLMRRRALLTHTTTYTLTFMPAIIWLATNGVSAGALVAAVAVIWLEHGVQDDGRALASYVRLVKGVELQPGAISMAIDQTFHIVVLFLVAIAIGS